MLIPPADERGIVCCRMAYLPIELGYAVVYPSIVHPQQHVGVEIIIVL
jgi:hypothetical protein